MVTPPPHPTPPLLLPLQLAKRQPDSQTALREEEPAEARRDPGRDLFLWAIVQNNKELAEIAWEQVTNGKKKPKIPPLTTRPRVRLHVNGSLCLPSCRFSAWTARRLPWLPPRS